MFVSAHLPNGHPGGQTGDLQLQHVPQKIDGGGGQGGG
jgi:hypothetical protein